MNNIEILKSVKLYARRTGVIRGRRYYDEDLVSNIEYKKDLFEFTVKGEVLSDSLINSYETEINIDISNNAIKNFKCTCDDFKKESDMYGRKMYACKHIVATSFKAIDMLSQEMKKRNVISKSNFMLESIESIVSSRRNIKLELSKITCTYTSFTAEFKIGEYKMYSVKNVMELLNAIDSKSELYYGKEFTFNPLIHYFSEQDRKILDYISGMAEIEKYSKSMTYSYMHSSSLLKGKYVKIPRGRVREFLSFYIGQKIDFEYNGLTYKGVEVRNDRLPLSFNIEENNNEIILNALEDMPVDVAKRGDIFFYKNIFYIPPIEQADKYKVISQTFEEEKSLIFKKSSLPKIITKLIPVLKDISSNVKIDEKIGSKIINDKLDATFYIDRNKGIIISVKFLYDGREANGDKMNDEGLFIVRDIKKEEEIIDTISMMGFVNINHKFVLKGDREYEFVKGGIEKLLKYGEVFYSDRFKNNKIHGGESIKANIKKTERGYLDFTFSIEGATDSEISNILKAFKDNRKYYKLKNEDFVNLEDENIRDMFGLIENLEKRSKLCNEKIQVPDNMAFYIDEFINEKDIRYLEGIDEIKSITDKVKNIDEHKFNVPDNLKNVLRKYQVTGFKWLNILAELGFGGILADEMGLGKTIQMISFLLSRSYKSTLIVCPTSLIYNWKSEIERFAPSIKAEVVVSDKETRMNIIKQKDEYDVLITSYDLLRRDIDEYKDLEFDVFIIDEAQNIKNPSSMNAKSVKSIKTNLKFALTGTPIENSLTELWSIFDFIMPGYLFSKSVFNESFEKKTEEEDTISELNKYIKPFILRRYKKDVIKELPDKIEKQIVVDMPEKQKKVYYAYAEDVKKKLEKHIEDDDLNTSKIEILSCLTRLRQLCLDPSVVMDGYKGGSGKIDALIEVLNDSIDQGHKVLVFSQFTRILKNISKRFEKEGITYCYLDGSVKSSERLKIVDNFNENKYSVFLISLKAGGTGLNLTSADTVIHFDPWWNPAVEDQATDRAHRFGQRNVVEVIKMVSAGTIEEKILKLQEQKKELISKVLGNQLQDSKTFLKLTDKDIASLFELKI